MKTSVKAAILFGLLFSIALVTHAQSLTLGGGIGIKTPGLNLNFGLGANLSAEFRFMENYAVRMNTGYILSAFHNNQYFGTDDYTQLGYEGDLLYYPFSGTPQIYGGLGMGYYISNTSIAGNPHYLGGPVSKIVVSNSVDRGPGYNLLGGVKFRAEKSFSINLEFKYIFLNTSWTSHIFDYGILRSVTVFDKINLNTLVTSVTFNYRF